MSNKGVIYILTNSSFKEYVKIGYADDVVIGDYAEFHIEPHTEDLLGGFDTVIDKFLSDRVMQKIEEFNQLFKDYNFPIVLCHCGMYDDCVNDLIHETLVELMNTYNNLYVDISYSAVDFYLNKPERLLEFDNKKVIIGTDINPVIYRQMNNPTEHSLNLYNKFYKTLLSISYFVFEKVYCQDNHIVLLV